MFEQFTDRARRATVLAHDEAKTFSHRYIDTEHILIGLIQEGEGIAAQTLQELGISTEAVRTQVKTIVGERTKTTGAYFPFAEPAKQVIELSQLEATRHGVNYVGTEHILLGLIRESECIGAQVLANLGGELVHVRQQVSEKAGMPT
jgi:ATP-dependent Clp protease ATP-binding subunit ClpC